VYSTVIHTGVRSHEKHAFSFHLLQTRLKYVRTFMRRVASVILFVLSKENGLSYQHEIFGRDIVDGRPTPGMR